MTLTADASVAFAEETPAVQVSVSSSPSVTDLITVWRIHEDGSLHQVLTSAHSTLIGTWTGIDYHAPFDQDLTYFAESGGLSSTSAHVWLPSNDQVWLIHPSDPSLSILADEVLPFSDFKYEGSAKTSRVLNSKLERSRSPYPLSGQSGTVTVYCRTPEKTLAVRALLEDGGPILLNDPHWEVGHRWIQPDGLGEHNPSPKRKYQGRVSTFGYKEVQQPDADVRIWTIAEFMAAWPTGGEPGADPDTIAAANSHYANLTAVKLDVRS